MRGGRRAATPGKAYQNRTDLSTSQGALPKATFTSTSYGSSTALSQAQNALPVAPQPGVAPAPGPSSPAGPPGAGVGGNPTPAPGSFGDHLRPTEQPNVPVTAGLPFGPGPGPEAIAPPVMQSPLVGALANLNALGSAASPLVNAVRAQVNAMSQAGMV